MERERKRDLQDSFTLIILKTDDPNVASDEKNDKFSIKQNISHET